MNGNGIEPVVQMGTLESLLTGRSYEEVTALHPAGHDLAVRDGGERMVLRLQDSLAEELAAASDDRLTRVAAPWSETEEFWGQADPDDLAFFLRELGRLARQAHASGQHLYCWLSV